MSKSKKNPKQFTIMIVPEPGGFVRKMTLPAPLARSLLATLAALAFFYLLTIGLLVYYRNGHMAYQKSQQEIAHLHVTMGEVHTELTTVEQTLERLSSFDTKLRMISQLRDPDRHLAMGPINYNPTELNSSDSPFDKVIPFLKLEEQPSNPDELLIHVKKLKAESTRREESLAELADQLRHQEIVLAATPATWPVHGRISSTFGMRVSPFSGVRKLHAGLDIAAAPGTPVYAPGNAKVVFVGSKEGYGKTLILDHGYGILTCFAHNSAVMVKRGENVKRGQLVTKVGNTGHSTGPHLHYEVRLRGTPQNPSLFILN